MNQRLDDIIARIADLENRHRAAEDRNAALEHVVLALREHHDAHRSGSGAAGPDPVVDSVSRRNVLRRGTAVAAGAAAGLVALRPQPAAATTGSMLYGTSHDAGTDSTSLTSSSTGGTLQLHHTGSNSGPALSVERTSASAGRAAHVRLTNAASTADGLYVENDGVGTAINAVNTNTLDSDPVVLATHNGDGIVFEGHSSNVDATASLASLTHHGKGRAISAAISNNTNAASVVFASTNGTGNVVEARTSGMGRAGVFQGGVAQIRLVPSTLGPTHPTTGSRGDLFCDKYGRLWFCKGGTTWTQLA